MYMLDTNICSLLIKKRDDYVESQVLHYGKANICISWIVAGELYFGAKHKNAPVLTQRVNEFLAYWQVMFADNNILEHYANIRADLTKKGTIIGANDLWIAAHARSLNHTLVTRNTKEFQRVEDLTITDWVK